MTDKREAAMTDEKAKRRAKLAEKLKDQVAYPQAKFLHEQVECDIAAGKD